MQWASKLQQLMQNIEKDIFLGLNALEKSTEVRYLQSFVLSRKGESLCFIFIVFSFIVYLFEVIVFYFLDPANVDSVIHLRIY